MLGLKTQWVGDALWCLLNLQQGQLLIIFPEHKWESLSRVKRLYKQKIGQQLVEQPQRPDWYTEGMSPDEIFERMNQLAPPIGETALSHLVSQESRDELHQQLDKLIDKGNFDANTVNGLDVLTGTYQQASKDPETGDVTVTNLHRNYVRLQYRRSADEAAIGAQPLLPAVAANITPTTERGVERDHRLLLVFGDMQIAYRHIDDDYLPIHDERAMRAVRLLAADLRPETIVNLGDTVDLPELGKYDPDSNHFQGTLGMSLQRAHNFYAELRADNPEARIVEVDSNHNSRLGKFVLRYAMPLNGLQQATSDPERNEKPRYPVMTYPHLLNLEQVNVEWVSGYDAAEFEYADDLVFKHGKQIRSNGSTAQMHSAQNHDRNIVVGHGHRHEQHSRSDRHGNYFTAVQVGSLCKITGEVPGYNSAVDDYGKVVDRQQGWQQSCLIIEDYGNGNYNFLNVFIKNGVAYFNGKQYDGNIALGANGDALSSRLI